MTAPHRAGAEGWNLPTRDPPGLKELTIVLGDSDIYVNLSRKIELDNGHTLYEAVLTDPAGSRAIYIDRDDIVDCLQDAFLGPGGAPPPAEPPEPPPAQPRRPYRGGT